jgi:hypothetical protein
MLRCDVSRNRTGDISANASDPNYFFQERAGNGVEGMTFPKLMRDRCFHASGPDWTKVRQNYSSEMFTGAVEPADVIGVVLHSTIGAKSKQKLNYCYKL